VFLGGALCTSEKARELLVLLRLLLLLLLLTLVLLWTLLVLLVWGRR